MSAVDRNWLQRFRSASLSSDLDVEENASTKNNNSKTRHLINSNKMSCAGMFKQITKAEYSSLLETGTRLLSDAPNCFPICIMPEGFKLSVFMSLSPADRGRAAQVCKEWSVMMKNQLLWSEIDLTSFPPYSAISSSGEDGMPSEDSQKAYEAYRARVKNYIKYLAKLRPIVRVLRFELDIGDVKDGWLDALTMLLGSAQCQELSHAQLGWTDTPSKPFSPEMSSATWSTNDTKDLMYRHRHRQRLFVKFFDLFTAVAPNVMSLTMPFDWTERSLCALRRLPNLEILDLQKYFIVQGVEQTTIDHLFTSAPFLRCLTVEIWAPSGRGLQSFKLRSETLEFLDVSKCRGFCFEEMSLPKLTEFRVSMVPMNGPLVSGEGVDAKCLYTTLITGAPNLRRLNQCRLEPNWNQQMYDDLESLLRSVCACSVHQSE